MATQPTNYRNQLLNRLSADDRELLRPHLVAVDLDLFDVLEEPDERIKQVYFIESGFASVVAESAAKKQIEIGLVGREGVTGTAVILGTGSSPHQTYVQVAGSAMRMSAPKLRAAMKASESLAALLLRYVHAFIVQTTRTAFANASGHADERLARWLLMADDRCDDNVVPLTHAFLSIMLGIRRTGVTQALNHLQDDGMISAGRGRIDVLDRTALKRKANAFYGVAEAEYRRLIS
jgi:CRP-like cAMP-binding protein